MRRHISGLRSISRKVFFSSAKIKQHTVSLGSGNRQVPVLSASMRAHPEQETRLSRSLSFSWSPEPGLTHTGAQTVVRLMHK